MGSTNLSSVFFLFIAIGAVEIVTSQSFYKTRDITVKIKANVQKGDGYGIVVFEENDTLYIATARHVVFSSKGEKATKIKVRFNDLDESFSSVEVENYSSQRDLALLKMKKPSKYNWEYRVAKGSIAVGDKLGIIGRDGTWNPTHKDVMGRVSLVQSGTIKADFQMAQEGNSGGPLINRNGEIVGMITDDGGNQITGITIRYIKIQIMDWLDIEDVSIVDIPYFNVGIQSGILQPFNITSNEKNALVDWNNRLPLELHLEAVIRKNISLRYSWGTSRLKTKEEVVDGIGYRFRNGLTSNNISLLYYPESSLLEMTTGYLIMGVSYIKITPEINVNGVGWVPYNEASGIDINDHSFSINFGLGASKHFNSGLTLTGEISFLKPFNKFLYVDVRKPLSEDQNKELLVSVGIKVGYSFRKKSMKIKLLR